MEFISEPILTTRLIFLYLLKENEIVLKERQGSFDGYFSDVLFNFYHYVMLNTNLKWDIVFHNHNFNALLSGLDDLVNTLVYLNYINKDGNNYRILGDGEDFLKSYIEELEYKELFNHLKIFLETKTIKPGIQFCCYEEGLMFECSKCSEKSCVISNEDFLTSHLKERFARKKQLLVNRSKFNICVSCKYGESIDKVRCNYKDRCLEYGMCNKE